MLEKGIKILNELMPEFADKESDVFRSELAIFGVSSKPEGKLVNSKILDADQFAEIFSAIKNKPDDLVFPVVQKICMKLQWRSVLKSIQLKLTVEKMENLIVQDMELKKHHKLFKHGIPTTQILFVGRQQYLTRIKELIENNKVDKDNESNLMKIAITGLGGVGKTQLVIRFIAKYQLEYDSIIWINAESYDTTVNGFTSLGQKLGTFNEKMDIRGNVEAVYSKLSDLYLINLLIFDNADDYIPKEFWFDALDNFVFIITSRNRKWPYFDIKVDVDVFPPEEAIELVKKSLSEANYDSTVEIDSLIKELQYFPLALQQAVAYVKQCHEEKQVLSNRFTINDYLREYVTERKKILLNFKTKLENNEVNFVTTQTTWTVTVTKLKNMRQPGLSDAEARVIHPVKILNLISFMDGTKIDPTYFLGISGINENHFGWSVVKLDQYSLVNKISIIGVQQKTMINVHKLVQEITRIRLQDEGQLVQTLESICTILVSQCPNENSMEDMAKCKDLLPHLVSIKHVMEPISACNENLQIKSTVLFNLQGCSERSGNFRLQIKCLLEYLLIQQKLSGYGSCSIVVTLTKIGRALWHCGHPKSTKVLGERSLTIANSQETFNCAEYADILSNLAMSHYMLGNFEKQKHLLEKAIIIQKLSNCPDITDIASKMTTLSLAYGQLGDCLTERRLLEDALKIMEQHCDPDHIHIAATLTNLATAHLKLGNYKRGLSVSKRALKIFENYCGSENIQVARTLVMMSISICGLGDPKTSTSLLERALKIEEGYFGLNHFEVASTLVNLAVAYMNLGDTQHAKDLLERALTIQEKRYGSTHVIVAEILNNLGLVYSKLGDQVKAKTLLEKALGIRENAFGRNHSHVANVLANLAGVYAQMGDVGMQQLLAERILESQKIHYVINKFILNMCKAQF